jgi:hypothetical protein
MIYDLYSLRSIGVVIAQPSPDGLLSMVTSDQMSSEKGKSVIPVRLAVRIELVEMNRGF